MHARAQQQDRAIVAASDLPGAIIDDAVVRVRFLPDAALATDLAGVDDVQLLRAANRTVPPNNAPLLPTNNFELPLAVVT